MPGRIFMPAVEPVYILDVCRKLRIIISSDNESGCSQFLRAKKKYRCKFLQRLKVLARRKNACQEVFENIFERDVKKSEMPIAFGF